MPIRAPVRKPYTAILTKDSEWPEGWGDLERLLAAAPALALRPLSNPLFPILPDRIEVERITDDLATGETLLLVREDGTDSVHRLLWLEIRNACRPKRLLEISNDELVYQLDFWYASVEDRAPSRWVVQVFHPENQHRDFAEAERIPDPPTSEWSAELFAPSADSYRAYPQPTPVNVHTLGYHCLRFLLSWPSLIVACLVVVACAPSSHAKGRRWNGWAFRWPSRRTWLVVLMVVGAFLALRSSPACDFPLGLAIVEVDNVWTRAKEVARSDADPAEWDHFVRDSERRLGPIAASLEATILRGPGIWGMLMPTDESADRTRHDLIQLIRNEIPEALNAQPRASAVQDRRLQPWLDRIQTYLMGARDG